MARNKFDIDEELETAFSAAHLKRILVYVKPYQKSIYITLFVILLANVATMIGPYLTKIVIDDTIPNKKHDTTILDCGYFHCFRHCNWTLYAIPH